MKRFIYISMLFAGLFCVSCDDFLDKVPDNRAELVSTTQIRELLVSGYSVANYAVLGELSSDNMVDNNAPNDIGEYYNVASFNKIDDEAFAWDDIVSDDEQDSPSYIWANNYHAIAVANHALQAIENLDAKVADTAEIKALRGEALLIRAYHHFILVNIFALTYKNPTDSENDPGIPYITEPEKTVIVIPERLSVAKVYDLIEKDLLEGLPLINDTKYEIPKYHFNKEAANAFAARFFLFKRDYDKVIEYAGVALGANPADKMRKWNITYVTSDAESYGYIDSKEKCNFMLVATTSFLNWRYYSSPRYSINGSALKGTIDGSGPTWSKYNYHPCFAGRRYISTQGQKFGVIFNAKTGNFFEYTDKIARIGYGHNIRTEFTAEETILCRAEAYINKQDFDHALTDLRVWDKARQILEDTTVTFGVLDSASIVNFYTDSKVDYVKKLNTEKISPEWTITALQNKYLQCLLHFRRIETVSDGMRWFDIKRYGIEITHKIGKTRVETLTWNDPRRAIQLPFEVIAAGMTGNDRTQGTLSFVKMQDGTLVAVDNN